MYNGLDRSRKVLGCAHAHTHARSVHSLTYTTSTRILGQVERSLTHSLAHSLTLALSLTRSPTHSLPYSHATSLARSLTNSLTRSLTHKLTPSGIRSLILPLAHSLTHPQTFTHLTHSLLTPLSHTYTGSNSAGQLGTGDFISVNDPSTVPFIALPGGLLALQVCEREACMRVY